MVWSESERRRRVILFGILAVVLLTLAIVWFVTAPEDRPYLFRVFSRHLLRRLI